MEEAPDSRTIHMGRIDFKIRFVLETSYVALAFTFITPLHTVYEIQLVHCS